MEKLRMPASAETTPQDKRETFREGVFHELVNIKVLEHVTEDLSDAGFEPDEIKKIQRAFLALPEASKKAVLSIPAQLRPKLYEKYADEVQEGIRTPESMIQDLAEKTTRNHYTLGYHLSAKEIKPDAQGNWVIKGTEPDHRHEDIPMAYYSLDYRNRYREKPTKFLYIVRAQEAHQSGHFQDNNGAWGHAPSLSVVDMINLQQLETEMDTLMAAEEKQKGETP